MGKDKIKIAKPEGLVPTKAALFGLDVRFRNIDRAILEDKQRRYANRPGGKNEGYCLNRHSYPEQAIRITSNSAGAGSRTNKKNF